MMRRALLLPAALLAMIAPASADMLQDASNSVPAALPNLTNHILTISPSGILQAGNGTNGLYGNGFPQTLAIYRGTAAAPITAAGQQLKIVAVHAVTKDKCGNNQADGVCVAPLVVQASGVPGGTMGTTAALFYAVGTATNPPGTFGNDVTGLGAQADIKDGADGGAMGAYIVARKFNELGAATGAEISVANYSNTNTCIVKSTGLGKCVGIWVAARGNNLGTPLASAIQIGTAAAIPGEIGYWMQGITVNDNTFAHDVLGTRTFADYSQSEVSLYIRGKHRAALITEPGDAGIVGLGTFNPTAKLEIDGNYDAPYFAGGVIFSVRDFAITDTTSSGVVDVSNANRFGTPILRATNPVTYTEAANLVVAGCPTADINVTITRCFALKIGGNTHMIGDLTIKKAIPSDPITAPGQYEMKFSVVSGSTPGTCKLVAYAGTSTTPTTVVDNVGATGC